MADALLPAAQTTPFVSAYMARLCYNAGPIPGAMALTFDAAAAADQPEIVALLRDCALPFEDIGEDVQHFLVAREGATLVGTVGIELMGPVALLRSLAVAPSHRGSGLGRELCARVFARARSAGVADLYLLTTTAARFFERIGFGVVARDTVPAPVRATEEFSRLCPASATAMSRRMHGDAPEAPPR